MAEFKLSAQYVAAELPIQKIKDSLKYKLVSEKRERLVYEVQNKKYLFVYSFGVLVFYNLDDHIMNEIFKCIKDLGVDFVKEKIADEYVVIEHLKTSVDFNYIRLKNVDLEKLKIISWVLAQSVALENYEEQVIKIVDKFSVLNKQLKDTGKLKVEDRELMRIVGTNSSIIESIISKLALLEKPASAWESQETEWIFNRLRHMFEIEERFKHIEYKLDFIQNNSEMMIDIINQHRANFLELIIIALFIVDLIIIAFEMLFFK